VETEKFWCSGSRFSKYVTKFCTISDALTKPEQYVNDLVKICKDNNANFFIPVCAPATEKLDSIVGQQVKSFGVQVLHAPISIFDKLNNKQQFGDYMIEIGLAVPEAFLVESDLGVFQINTILKQRIKEGGENERWKHKFILKNIEYDPVHRLDLFSLPAEEKDVEAYLQKISKDGNPITAKRPWTIQRFIDGDMWSSCQLQIDGEVCFFSCTKSSSSCFNWKHDGSDQIKEWNLSFAKKLKITGIFSIDFILDKHDGIAYAIECNPRLHSLVSLFHANDNMADVIMGHCPQKHIEPVSKMATYTTFNELFILLDPAYYADINHKVNVLGRLQNFVKTIREGYDPILDEEDLLPFFMINFFQIPVLLYDTYCANRPWKKIDFQIGKVVELGGY